MCALHIVPRACGKFIDVELLRNSLVGARYQARISEKRVHIYCGVFVCCLGFEPCLRACTNMVFGIVTSVSCRIYRHYWAH